LHARNHVDCFLIRHAGFKRDFARSGLDRELLHVILSHFQRLGPTARTVASTTTSIVAYIGI
jgi:hypothetical protein